MQPCVCAEVSCEKINSNQLARRMAFARSQSTHPVQLCNSQSKKYLYWALWYIDTSTSYCSKLSALFQCGGNIAQQLHINIACHVCVVSVESLFSPPFFLLYKSLGILYWTIWDNLPNTFLPPHSICYGCLYERVYKFWYNVLCSGSLFCLHSLLFLNEANRVRASEARNRLAYFLHDIFFTLYNLLLSTIFR